LPDSKANDSNDSSNSSNSSNGNDSHNSNNSNGSRRIAFLGRPPKFFNNPLPHLRMSLHHAS